MGNVDREVRQSLRKLARSPGLSFTIVFTLAVAIGPNLTIFGMIDALVLDPGAFAKPESIFFLWGENPQQNVPRDYVSPQDFLDLRERMSSAETLEAYRPTVFNLSAEGGGSDRPDAARVDGVEATPGFFGLLAERPLRGRLPSPEPGEREVLISHRLWQERFAADPEALGAVLLLDEVPHTVIAVMPPELEGALFRSVDAWRPLHLERGAASRVHRNLSVVGRMVRDGSLAAVDAEGRQVARQLESAYPRTNSGWSLSAVSLSDQLVGPQGRFILRVLVIMVALVLLIACANVGNLLLARSAGREREVALRTALGAGRWGIFRQLTVEHLLLALAGGIAGLLVTVVMHRVLVAITRRQVGLLEDLSLNGTSLLFALALVLITPLLFGLVPVVRAFRSDLTVPLREDSGRSTASRSRHRWLASFVCVQVAFAVLLLVFSGLMVRSLLELLALDPGFESERLLTARIDLSSERYGEPARRASFFEALAEGLEGEPGVERAAVTSHRPILGGEPRRTITVLGRELPDPDELPWVKTVSAGPGYFDTLGVAVLRGRTLGSGDAAGAQLAGVINRAASERYWGGADPLGSHVRLEDEDETSDPERPWIEIVGVVADLRNPDADQPPEPHLYLPLGTRPPVAAAVVARTSGPPLDSVAALRRQVARLDPHLPVHDVRSMEQILHDDMGGSYVAVGLMVIFAVIAVVLASAGIFGVVAYSMGQRRQEIGIRRAFGARGRDILRLALRQVALPLGLGIGLGLGITFFLAGFLEGMLFEVGPRDPLTLVSVPLLLLGLGLVAGYVPALQALRIEPAVALRQR